MGLWEGGSGGGGGGVTDHGALTGLADDDHTQYHNDARGDARYAPIAKGVTNGDAHDHSGGDGAQIDHAGLANIGTNTHGQIDTHLASTANPHAVTKAQVGLGDVANLKVNLSAITAPTANDDSAAGYAVGSRWMDTVADKEYVCLDASVGAAVWKETSQVIGASLASFMAYLGSNQSITQNVNTVLAINTETVDIGGYYDTAAYKWTPPAGRCLIGGAVLITGITAGVTIIFSLLKNGAVHKRGAYLTRAGTGTADMSVNMSAMVEANGTDYFQLVIMHADIAARNAYFGDPYTYFWGTHLG